jgi:biopolymer transport protein ExbB/TolQ
VGCPLLWPSIALGAAAICLALVRGRTLAIHAPLALQPFVRSLTALIERGDLGGAAKLCDRLQPAWGAQLASAALHAASEERAFAIEEVSARLQLEAQRHLYALRTLGRMALPLSLGSAIVELGLGFGGAPGSAIAVGAVQGALDCALRVVATGFATALFCQLAGSFLQQQARERSHDVRSIAEMLASQMSRMTR